MLLPSNRETEAHRGDALFRSQSRSGTVRAGSWGSSPAPRCPLSPQGLPLSTSLCGDAPFDKEVPTQFLFPPEALRCICGAPGSPMWHLGSSLCSSPREVPGHPGGRRCGGRTEHRKQGGGRETGGVETGRGTWSGGWQAEHHQGACRVLEKAGWGLSPNSPDEAT